MHANEIFCIAILIAPSNAPRQQCCDRLLGTGRSLIDPRRRRGACPKLWSVAGMSHNKPGEALLRFLSTLASRSILRINAQRCCDIE